MWHPLRTLLTKHHAATHSRHWSAVVSPFPSSCARTAEKTGAYTQKNSFSTAGALFSLTLHVPKSSSSSCILTPARKYTVPVNGEWLSPVNVSFNRRDAIVYSLGVGLTQDELQYTWEDHPEFSVFPTYPFVLAFKGDSSDVVSFPSPAMSLWEDILRQYPPLPKGSLLDAERHMEIKRPFPVQGGTFKMFTKFTALTNKRNFAYIETEQKICDTSGEVEYARILSGTAAMGLSEYDTFGRTQFQRVPRPRRPCDHSIDTKVGEHQNLLYRLSGDYNPLHVDPEVAKDVGFPGPIIHGLCTLGIATAKIVKLFSTTDQTLFKGIRVRWTAPVFPGDHLRIEIWHEAGSSRILFEVMAASDEYPDYRRVITNAYIDCHSPPQFAFSYNSDEQITDTEI
eukprot:CFRG6170T1